MVASGFERRATDNGTTAHERRHFDRKLQKSLEAAQGQPGARCRHSPITALLENSWAGGTPAQRV
jgi:hypothetical protein